MNSLHQLVSMKAVNYHHLNYFRVIAVAGGIAAASKVLRVSQSALSTQLRSFEDFFGHPLFHRNNRKMALTDFGRIILGYANDIYRLGAEMIEVANDGLTLGRSQVHLGVAPGVSKKQVMALVRRVFAMGDCNLTISEGSPELLAQELLGHRVDLVLSPSALSAPQASGLHSLLIERARVAFYGHRNFRLSPEELPYCLHERPLILPTTRQRLRQELDLYFEAREIKVRVVAEVDDTVLQSSMAQAGLGIIAVPENAIKTPGASCKLVNLGHADSIHGECWIHSASRRVENPVAGQVIRSLLREAATATAPV